MAKPRGAWVRTTADWFFDHGNLCGGKLGTPGGPSNNHYFWFKNNSTLGLIAHIFAFFVGPGPDSWVITVAPPGAGSTLINTGSAADSQGKGISGQMFGLATAVYTDPGQPILVLPGLSSSNTVPNHPIFAVRPGDSIQFSPDTLALYSAISVGYIMLTPVGGFPN